MNNRLNLVIPFITLVIMMLGFGVIIPILPDRVVGLGGSGIAMGLNNACMSLGRVIGPLWAGSTIAINTPLPFITGTAIMLLSFFVSLIFLKGTSSPEPIPVIESVNLAISTFVRFLLAPLSGNGDCPMGF